MIMQESVGGKRGGITWRLSKDTWGGKIEIG